MVLEVEQHMEQLDSTHLHRIELLHLFNFSFHSYSTSHIQQASACIDPPYTGEEQREETLQCLWRRGGRGCWRRPRCPPPGYTATWIQGFRKYGAPGALLTDKSLFIGQSLQNLSDDLSNDYDILDKLSNDYYILDKISYENT